MTLQSAPPGLDYERDRKFSKVSFERTRMIKLRFNTFSPYVLATLLQSFKQMIASCLVKDPSKRPSARKLLKHSFFKQARSNDYIARTLLDGLPALGDRMQALKVSISSVEKQCQLGLPVLFLWRLLLILEIKQTCYWCLIHYRERKKIC